MDGLIAELPSQEPADLLQRIHALGDALESHYDWLWQVQRAVVCDAGGVLPESNCTLDQWFAGAHGGCTGEATKALADLRTSHDTVHRAAADMLGAAARESRVPVILYDAFLRARKSFKQAATRLERTLWSDTCLLDGLTGLRNRHGMIMELREAQQRALRDGRPCSLAMMDLDHFKAINDGHGHLTGDEVLRSVTRLTTRRLRPYDRMYRYGGEEFLLCLPDTDLDRAQAIVDRLRQEIAEHPVVTGVMLRVTVSFGLAALDGRLPVEDSLRRADRALYAAKEAGRNCVMAALPRG